MKIKVEALTQEAFSEFGTVIGQPAGDPNLTDSISTVWLGFSDLMDIGKVPGKQCTFLKIHSNPPEYSVVEKHDTSAEAFIPLEGKSILLVAPASAQNPDMSQARAFLIDGTQGVLFPKGTWHAVPYILSDSVSYLVLVDDAIVEKEDIIKTDIEPIEFDLSDFSDSFALSGTIR